MAAAMTCHRSDALQSSPRVIGARQAGSTFRQTPQQQLRLLGADGFQHLHGADVGQFLRREFLALGFERRQQFAEARRQLQPRFPGQGGPQGRFRGQAELAQLLVGRFPFLEGVAVQVGKQPLQVRVVDRRDHVQALLEKRQRACRVGQQLSDGDIRPLGIAAVQVQPKLLECFAVERFR